MIPKEVIEDWARNKKRIQDRLNRIRKRMKKLAKQEKHFAMRLRMIDMESHNLTEDIKNSELEKKRK